MAGSALGQDDRRDQSGDAGGSWHGAGHGAGGHARRHRRCRLCLSRLARTNECRARRASGGLARTHDRASGRSSPNPDARTGQAIRRGHERDPIRCFLCQMVCGGSPAHRRHDNPLANGRSTHPGSQGAGRRVRHHHALEFPERHDHTQGGARARGGVPS